ncbi:hypothetical protein [Streptomyces sp. NPDC059003]|uniref:hypothetical protein n=1 Tax=Streptomyces sp. NPDC059003 TaxID=3346691 RepID=UPI00367E0FAB
MTAPDDPDAAYAALPRDAALAYRRAARLPEEVHTLDARQAAAISDLPVPRAANALQTLTRAGLLEQTSGTDQDQDHRKGFRFTAARIRLHAAHQTA